MRGQVPKVCPRCGAFYQSLTSNTCPQCFAKLNTLSDSEAEELVAEQELRSRDPEFIRGKSVEDESFKERSFGACLGIAAVLVAIVLISTVLCIMAVRRQKGAPYGPSAIIAPATRAPGMLDGALPADFDRIVPVRVGTLRRVGADADLTLPGTVARIYHGIYAGGVQAFAVDSSSPTQYQLSMLNFVADVAARQHQPPLIEQNFATIRAKYIALGPSAQRVNSLAISMQR
jgi:hypothetical protein